MLSQIKNLENITLIGYSQGAILALSIALNSPDKIKKVVSINGYLEKLTIKKNKETLNTKTKFLFLNGRNDQIINPKWSKETKAYFRLKKIKFKNVLHNENHSFAEEEEKIIINWIKETL